MTENLAAAKFPVSSCWWWCPEKSVFWWLQVQQQQQLHSAILVLADWELNINVWMDGPSLECFHRCLSVHNVCPPVGMNAGSPVIDVTYVPRSHDGNFLGSCLFACSPSQNESKRTHLREPDLTCMIVHCPFIFMQLIGRSYQFKKKKIYIYPDI